jgi:hypothetical protein
MATLFLFRALYSTASHLSFYAFETHDMWEIICSWSVGPNRHWSRLTDEEDFVTAAHVCIMLAVADSSIGALNMQQSTLYVWNRRCAIQSSKFQNSAILLWQDYLHLPVQFDQGSASMFRLIESGLRWLK